MTNIKWKRALPIGWIVVIVLGCSWGMRAFSQGYTLELANGKFLNIQTCNNQTFRIRVASSSNFPETLMERYGIVKKDWGSETNVTKQGSDYRLTTDQNQLDIDAKDGKITLRSLSGGERIMHLSVLEKGDKSYSGLHEAVTDYEQALTKKEIIGDTTTDDRVAEGIKRAESQSDPAIVRLSITPDERFYGGGAASRKAIQHRGSLLRIWATYQQSDMVAPFLVSSRGWGIFNNTTALNYFDVGHFEDDQMYVYNTDGTVDFYLMAGQSLENTIDLYTTITGKPYLLPKWAYGLAFGGNMMEDQFRMLDNAVRFRTENIPVDVYWIEPQWMAKFYDYSTEKDWDLSKFPAYFFWQKGEGNRYENKQLFLSKLRQLGYHVALWLCIDHDLSIEEEDHFAAQHGGKQSGEAHWFPHLMRFVDQGIDGFKLDPGRTLDEHPDRVYYNGYTDREMHNLNQVLLPKQMYRVFREHKGVRSFHHYCGGYAGSQHWGASTAGDNGGGRAALYDQLNLGLSGFLNTSADVLDAVEDVKAGFHFGFFLPWVQINSWASMHYPWYFSPEYKETFRFYAQLRNSLLPYIYATAIQGSQTGMPILRAMPLVFPQDREVENMTTQFMFGEHLLVSAFTDSIYLPAGKWVNYWSGEKVKGGQTVSPSIPTYTGGQLFVKAGAIIPLQKPMQYVGQNPLDTLLLKVYPAGSSGYTLLEDDGVSFDFEQGKISKTQFECKEKENEIEFIVSPTTGAYEGMPDRRAYEIVFNEHRKPSRVELNGRLLESWKIGEDGLAVSLPLSAIGERQVLKVIMGDIDAEIACGMHPHRQIDYVKNQLYKGSPDYTAAYRQLIKHADKALLREPNAVNRFHVPAFYEDKEGHRAMRNGMENDAFAAYCTALAYMFNDDTAYAEKSISFLNAWAKINQEVGDADSPLVLSYVSPGLLIAAQLLKNAPIWQNEDKQLFRNWIKKVVLPAAKGIRERANNWGDWSRYASLLAAELLDDSIEFAYVTQLVKKDLTSKIAPDGFLIEEVKRQEKGLWYSYFSLAPITASAWVIYNRGGENLFAYQQDSISIKQALNYLQYYQRRPNEWPWYPNPETADKSDVEVCWPDNLMLAMRNIYPGQAFTKELFIHEPVIYSKHHFAWTFPSLMPVEFKQNEIVPSIVKN